MQTRQRLVQQQILITRNGKERTLNVRVAERARARRTSATSSSRSTTSPISCQRAAHLGLGGRRAPHRARDQEPADADPALGRAHPAQIRQGDHRPTAKCSTNAPPRSCARSTTSSAWSTSSRPSRACRSRRSASEDLVETIRQVVFMMRIGASGDRVRGRPAGRPAGHRRSTGGWCRRRSRTSSRTRPKRSRPSRRTSAGRAEISVALDDTDPDSSCRSRSPTTARASRSRAGSGCSSPT